MQGTRFNPWVRKVCCRRECQPTPVFWPLKSHRQGSLVGYSPWGCKESDKTSKLNHHQRAKEIYWVWYLSNVKDEWEWLAYCYLFIIHTMPCSKKDGRKQDGCRTISLGVLRSSCLLRDTGLGDSGQSGGGKSAKKSSGISSYLIFHLLTRGPYFRSKPKPWYFLDFFLLHEGRAPVLFKIIFQMPS